MLKSCVVSYQYGTTSYSHGYPWLVITAYGDRVWGDRFRTEDEARAHQSEILAAGRPLREFTGATR